MTEQGLRGMWTACPELRVSGMCMDRAEGLARSPCVSAASHPPRAEGGRGAPWELCGGSRAPPAAAAAAAAGGFLS